MDDLEKKTRAPLLGYIKLCPLFESHRWISNWHYSPETLNSGQNWKFLARLSLIFDRWPWKIIGAPLLCYFKLCASFCSHRSVQSGATVWKCPSQIKIGDFFVLCDLEIQQMTLKNNITSLLCYFKLCSSFHSHRSIQTWVAVQKHQIRVKIDHFFLCNMGMWWMTLKNNKAPLLC